MGMYTQKQQQGATTSSPFVPSLLLNVLEDSLSCVSGSVCSAGS